MRLIDADALIDDIEHCLWDWESVDDITASTVLKQTITDIKNQPTIDAVPVIRCKDCARRTFTKCPMAIGNQSDYDFCSRAERKEE